MIKKYELVDESGRKRLRALRNFSVQGREVNVHDLGGYVYDEKTLSQDGSCWIFSGSLEYPGVRVMDEAIVDMGIDTAKVAPRMRVCTIRGNSRVMGAISFESAPADVLQTPATFEQGSYQGAVGNVPVKVPGSTRVRIPVPVFAGTVGSVAITSTAYKAKLISLNEAGIVVSASAWTVGGPAVTLTSTDPYILVEVCKVGDTAIAPADVTAAGITITSARGSSLDINNSSIVPVYNGVPAVSNIMRIQSVGTGSLLNCSMRAECVYNKANSLLFESDAIKTNFFLALSGGTQLAIRGFKLRNTNFYSRQSLPAVGPQGRVIFDVSDCPAFTYDPGTFPDAAGFLSSGKTFYFKNCNMPAGSAIHYYDLTVNVWDNIDFTKAMADLGRSVPSNPGITLVSSNKQGMYRMYGITSKKFGALTEALSSVLGANFTSFGDSYDSVIYKDCVIKGLLAIIGRNVFGGTLGGASGITNTSATAMVVDGNFRIDGNAQVTDTPLKGNGYIGGNAELRNGDVMGYIYMDGNAKYIPAAVANPQSIRNLVMRDNAQVLKQGANRSFGGAMFGNSKISAVVSINFGRLMMTDDAVIDRADDTAALNLYGECSMRDKASITGTGIVVAFGEAGLVGGFNLSAGSRTIYGKQVIASPDDVNRPELPPTKITW
ncbi:hypothetical protein BT61P2_00006 [Bacteroides phage BT61P2]|nr:hypothetical protein BT61P1_00005 [Bacteroides phage BT61P1]WAX09078.1 hypothetical protein BT61P2_00006 [Bacteroides phage BT61P2]